MDAVAETDERSAAIAPPTLVRSTTYARSRSLAFLVDSGIICTAGLLAVIVAVILSTRFPIGFRHVLFAYLAVGALTQLAYETVMEARWGATVGMSLAGPSLLRVLRQEGSGIGWREAFMRSVVGLLEANLALGPLGGLPAGVVAMISPRRQRLGDLLEGTLVAERAKDARPGFRALALTVLLVLMSALGGSVLLTLVFSAPATKCW